MEANVAEHAASVGKSAEEYKKTMDARQLEYIENDIVVTKLFDFLMKNNDMITEGGAEKKPAAKKTASAKAETGAESAKKPAAKKSAAKSE